MTVVDKANELGMMLKESSEYVRLQKAQVAQQSDTDAQLLLMNYNRKREELVKRAQKENITKDEMQEIRNEMQAEFDKLNQNANIVEFIDAMQQFNEMMDQVNHIVASYVSPHEEGCNGSCSSCGGCH